MNNLEMECMGNRFYESRQHKEWNGIPKERG